MKKSGEKLSCNSSYEKILDPKAVVKIKCHSYFYINKVQVQKQSIVKIGMAGTSGAWDTGCV